MKKLLVLVLLVLVAAGGVAQMPYSYEGCTNRIGVIFSASSSDFELNSQWTNYDYQQFIGFYMHLILISSVGLVSAYEMQASVLPGDAGLVITWEPPFGSGWINIGTTMNHIAAFSFPQPAPGGVVRLGAWQIVPLHGQETRYIAIGPAVPSHIGGDGPVIVIGGTLWRTNFTPGQWSGCAWDVAPGVAPAYVGTLYEDGVDEYRPPYIPPVAVDPMSLTSVKALFK